MPPALQAAARVFFRAGAQSSGCFFRYVFAGEGFKVAEEERNHLLVVDDFDQIRPIEWLLGEGLDTSAVNRFLRPAKTGQHQIKFRCVNWLDRLHWLSHKNYVVCARNRQVSDQVP